MANDRFIFAPNSQVPVTLAPDPVQGMSMNGWQFSARPTVPYQKKFKVTLYGMKWFLNPTTDLYDAATQPEINARALEIFYETHGTWAPFYWKHPHLGDLLVRFSAKVDVPEGLVNSDGTIDKFDVNFIHHNPGY